MAPLSRHPAGTATRPATRPVPGVVSPGATATRPALPACYRRAPRIDPATGSPSGSPSAQMMVRSPAAQDSLVGV